MLKCHSIRGGFMKWNRNSTLTIKNCFKSHSARQKLLYQPKAAKTKTNFSCYSGRYKK